MDLEIPSEPSTPGPELPGPRTPSQMASGALALVAAVVTLTAGFLPVLSSTFSDESIGFFDCQEVPGCTWLGIWVLGTAVLLGFLGVTVLAAPRAGSGTALVATGVVGGLVFLGWLGFGANLDDAAVSVGIGPPIGVAGTALGAVAGVVSIAGSRRPDRTGATEAGSVPGDLATWTAPVLAMIGAAAITVAAFIPYASFVEGEEPTIADCGTPGCAWFAIDPIALALVAIAVSVLVLARVIGRLTATAAFAVAGTWGVVLFLGYVGFGANAAEAFGEGASGGPAGAVGVAGGVAILAAGVVSWLARPGSTEAAEPAAEAAHTQE